MIAGIFRFIGDVIKLISISKAIKIFSTNDFYKLLFGAHCILNRISNSFTNDFYKLLFGAHCLLNRISNSFTNDFYKL